MPNRSRLLAIWHLKTKLNPPLSQVQIQVQSRLLVASLILNLAWGRFLTLVPNPI